LCAFGNDEKPMKYTITSPKQRVANAGHRALRLMIAGSVLEIVVALCIAVAAWSLARFPA
jgi:hypothetical protein